MYPIFLILLEVRQELKYLDMQDALDNFLKKNRINPLKVPATTKSPALTNEVSTSTSKATTNDEFWPYPVGLYRLNFV